MAYPPGYDRGHKCPAIRIPRAFMSEPALVRTTCLRDGAFENSVYVLNGKRHSWVCRGYHPRRKSSIGPKLASPRTIKLIALSGSNRSPGSNTKSPPRHPGNNTLHTYTLSRTGGPRSLPLSVLLTGTGPSSTGDFHDGVPRPISTCAHVLFDQK